MAFPNSRARRNIAYERKKLISAGYTEKQATAIATSNAGIERPKRRRKTR